MVKANLRNRLARLENTPASEAAALHRELSRPVEVIEGSEEHRAALAFPFSGMILEVHSPDEPGPAHPEFGNDQRRVAAMVAKYRAAFPGS